MLTINYLCEPSIRIPRFPCLISMAKAVLSTVKLVNCFTFDSVDSFRFAMCGLSSKPWPIALDPGSAGQRRTSWQMLHMMPRLLVSSIPQWKYNHHKGLCLESFQATGRLQPVSIEAHQASSMIGKVRSYQSWIKTHSVLEDILTCSRNVFDEFESDITGGNWNLWF